MSRLAVEHIENTGRPLRIAIDISIWQFQIQSGQGGKNPALRTLYYRLLKLLALSIQPLFVFDGPHRPPFKRGKKTTSNTVCLPNFLTKELLKCFGFPYHTAPGEAEAECALLQKEGVVDAVLSEDVDTLMFGCTMSLRNWTIEAVRGNKSPTHVNVYRAAIVRTKTRLDSEGMILVALMSGGDYMPAGIPGCGIKTACEAAKAGFGKDLCKLLRNDTDGLKQWRERLERELRTNESNFFRQRHKAMGISERFPNMSALGYYTDPVVSSPEKVLRLRSEMKWDSEINVSAIRLFVLEAFDWQWLSGAKKFVRGLAPALLAHQLIQRGDPALQNDKSLEAKASAEERLVKAISSRRVHWNTDGVPELRIAYTPADIVGLDFSKEEEDDYQGYTVDASADERLASDGEEDRNRSLSARKKRGQSTCDPTQIEKVWIMETFVKLGVPLLVETWEEEMRNPKKFASRKAREKKTLSKSRANMGPMDQFVKITKAGIGHKTGQGKLATAISEELPPSKFLTSTRIPQSPSRTAASQNRKRLGEKVKKNTAPVGETNRLQKETEAFSTGPLPSSSPVDIDINPWTLSKRPSDTFGVKYTTRYSALGIYPSDGSESAEKPIGEHTETQKITQYIESPSTSPPPKTRLWRTTTPVSDGEERETVLQHQETTIGPSTPTRRHPSKPLPRKRWSPLQLGKGLVPAEQLRTPESIRTERSFDKVTSAGEELLTPCKVNHRGRLTISVPNFPSSDKSPLPSLSPVLPPSAPEQVKVRSFSPLSPSIPWIKAKPTKKLAVLRESLEGAWKQLEPWEADRASAKGIHSVEVLDMTGS